MSSDVMSVRLHLRGVRVTEVVVDTPSELVVGVVSARSCRGVRIVVVRAGGYTTAVGDRSVIWRSAAVELCCYGPNGASCATNVASGTWKTHSQFWVV